MTSSEIMAEVKAVQQVEEGRAMWYTPHEDRVIMGHEGCQPTNTLCLRVGPDDLSNIDLGEIEESVVDMLAYWGRS